MSTSSQKPFEDPLAKAKGRGPAGHGTDHWIGQRLTAIANIPLVLWFVYSMVSLSGSSYLIFTGWLAQPINAVLMILLIISAFYHAALGSQVVVEDYVHCSCLKIVKLIGIKFFFFAGAVACIFSILKIAFGG